MNKPAISFSVVKRGCFKTSKYNNSKARKLNFAFLKTTDVTASALRRSRRRRRRQFVGEPPARCL